MQSRHDYINEEIRSLDKELSNNTYLLSMGCIQEEDVIAQQLNATERYNILWRRRQLLKLLK